MSITLSTTVLPDLEGSRTYVLPVTNDNLYVSTGTLFRRQDPQIKKRSKSANSRMKRRLKREKEKLQEPLPNTESVHDAPMTE